MDHHTDAAEAPSAATDVASKGADDELRAADGRIPGRRGRETRDRILEATEHLLATSSFRDLKVADIAREVGCSPATFYQYFKDVEEAILVLGRGMVEDGARLTAPLADASWSGRGATTAAEALVDAFLGFWRDHAAVLRVVDLAIVEGNRAFRDLRNELLAPVSKGIARAVREMKADGRHPDEVDPRAQAGVLVSMLAHVAEHRQGQEAWGIDEAAARTSMARIVVWSVTGRKPA